MLNQNACVTDKQRIYILEDDGIIEDGILAPTGLFSIKASEVVSDAAQSISMALIATFVPSDQLKCLAWLTP